MRRLKSLDMFAMIIFDGFHWHDNSLEILGRVNNVCRGVTTLVFFVYKCLYLKTHYISDLCWCNNQSRRYSDDYPVIFWLSNRFGPFWQISLTSYVFLWRISPMPVVLPYTGSDPGISRSPLCWSSTRTRPRSGSSSRRWPSTANANVNNSHYNGSREKLGCFTWKERM